MSFQALLDCYQSFYTNFTLSEFNPTTQTPIIRHIQLPYLLGAKNIPSSIQSFLRSKLWDASNYYYPPESEIQTFANNNKSKCGVDCSGLVLYVLNEASEGAVMSYFQKIDPKITGYAYGISADMLSSTLYGEKRVYAKDIVPGCTFRMDNGGHIAVVYNVIKNSNGVVTEIRYAHSNGSKGPHTAYITIGDQTKDLKSSSQTWHDIAYTDSTAKGYYNQAVLLEPIKSLV